MTRSTKRRARRSPQQWNELLAACDARTTSADDVCDQLGVASSNVHCWRQKLAATPNETRPTAASNRIVPTQFEAHALTAARAPGRRPRNALTAAPSPLCNPQNALTAALRPRPAARIELPYARCLALLPGDELPYARFAAHPTFAELP